MTTLKIRRVLLVGPGADALESALQEILQRKCNAAKRPLIIDVVCESVALKIYGAGVMPYHDFCAQTIYDEPRFHALVILGDRWNTALVNAMLEAKRDVQRWDGQEGFVPLRASRQG